MSAAEIDSLAEALIDANDTLLSVLDLADVTAASLDDNEVVPLILERTVRVVGAEAITLHTAHRSFGSGPAEIQHALVIDPQGTARATVNAAHSSGLEGELRAAKADGQFSTLDRKLLVVALRTALSSIESARLHRESVASAVATREQQQASEIAQLVLPRWPPALDGIDVFFESDQVRSTGGDLVCFDIVDDTLLFAVGDVSGKGLPAAVMMTTAVCAIHAAFRDARFPTPGLQLNQVNQWLFDHLTEAGLFLTLFIGQVSRDDPTLQWANAGHSPCVLSTSSGPLQLAATTPPLGVTQPIDDASVATLLGPTDVLFVGSDGVVEQPSATGEMFGEERLQHALAEYCTASSTSSSSTIGTRLRQASDDFRGATEQQDDRTVVIVQRHSGTTS